MTAKDIPNIISITRMVLVIPVVFLMLEKALGWALLLFIIAGISDGIDGYLAKRFNWHSRLGSILDPLADKLLLISSFIALTWLSLIPVWLTAAIISRDIVIVIGAITYHYFVGKYEMEPTLISKINTFVQLSLVVFVMFSEGVWYLGQTVTQFLIYITLFTTIASGILYVVIWGKRTLNSNKVRQ